MKTKVCSKCGVEKAITQFVKDAKYADGQFCWCKACKQDYDKEYKERPKIDKSYKVCTKCHKTLPINEFHRSIASRDGHHTICKACKCARQTDKYWNNPDHRKKILDNGHDFYQKHADRYKQYAYERKQRVRNAPGSHTRQEWETICQKYDYRCLCCGKRKKLTRDHIVPVIKGGNDDISNIQPLCSRCNSRKGTKTIDYRPLWESGSPDSHKDKS